MTEEQLYLFYEPTEDKLQRKVDELTQQLTNTRKGLFKRHQELEKKCLDMQRELEILKWRESKAIGFESLF